MQESMNEAAQLIKSAQSNVTDLTVQITELIEARSRQQALIDSLLPVASWGSAGPGEEVDNVPGEEVDNVP